MNDRKQFAFFVNLTCDMESPFYMQAPSGSGDGWQAGVTENLGHGEGSLNTCYPQPLSNLGAGI